MDLVRDRGMTGGYGQSQNYLLSYRISYNTLENKKDLFLVQNRQVGRFNIAFIVSEALLCHISHTGGLNEKGILHWQIFNYINRPFIS